MPTETSAKSPATPPAKPGDSAPAEKPIDRFHPEMPTIPGVTGVRPHSPPSLDPANTQRLAQILGALAAIAAIVFAIVWWVKSSSRKAADAAAAEPTPAESPLPQLPSLAVPPPHTGPTGVATVEELSKPWSAKKFNFQKPVTGESIPALVVRLPGGALWAFALKEPYGNCELEYVASTDQLASKYNFQASHPMVVNPCTSTVYDPLKVGPLGDNTWARGEVVQGSGLRPPLSIDVVVRGHSIVADRME
ncbi:MAG: hypothetical protein LAO19_00655 [Acidobacteriia bacterium]|nr:hypothetical protein [Terriglobia bacterium]